MARVVFDPNVLVSALISAHGAPAALYLALTRGRLELVASPQLLAELDDVLSRAKFRRYASLEQAHAFVAAVGRLAILVDDPPAVSGLTADPGDDYLVGLARAVGADAIVSGDRHLLDLSEPQPLVLAPRELLQRLDEEDGPGISGRSSAARRASSHSSKTRSPRRESLRA